MNTKISTATLLLALSPFTLAKDFSRPLDNFTGIGTATGIQAEVVCGANNTVEFNIDEDKEASVKTTVSGGMLKIAFDRDGWGNWFSNSEPPPIKIVTNGQLSEFKASTGSRLTVAGCAVDAEAVSVKLSTGSIANISGKTGELDLKLSTGSVFNEDSDESLVAETVTIKASTGSVAKLCGAKKVVGKLSTGSVVSVGRSSQTDVSLSTGAAVERNCN